MDMPAIGSGATISIGSDGEKVNLSLYADGAIVMSDGNGAYISLDLQQQRLLRRMLEG